MKSLRKLSAFFVLAGIVVIISCKKEYSCENCAINPSIGDSNKPPVANAGPDQVITLPTESIFLDGSASSDPDGTISAWNWTKITGSSSFTIINSSVEKTIVKNLVAGTYRFELKVTDAGGLFSKDTMTVTVNPIEPNQIGCNITMETMTHLPTSGSIGYAVSTGNKILFARPSSNNTVDIYDTLTHNWQTVIGMEATGYYLASSKAAVVNNKIIFSGPEWNNGQPPMMQIVNIYDAVSNLWSVNHLSQSRAFYAMTVVGNKAIYAGGEGTDSTISKKIDVYNATSNSWSVVNFNEGRPGMVAANVGNKVVLAGGYIKRYDSLVWVCDDYGNNCDSVHPLAPVNRVDVWDMTTNSWTVTQLSEARCFIVTAVVGNKIIFAGGDKLDGRTASNQIDIYDAVNNSWSYYTVPPSSWYGPCLAYTVGSKVLICNWTSDRIDIYDAISNSWSVVHMSEPLIGEQHQFGQVAVAGNKIVFFVQYNAHEDNSRNIDVYDASTNTWCHTQLNQGMIRQGIVTCGNNIYVAGGGSCCYGYQYFDNVWRLNY